MSKVIQFVRVGLDLERTFDSVEEALADYQRLTGEGFNPEDEISLGVAVDDNGRKSFCIGSPFTFTNCLVEDIKSWKSWYEDAWFEKIAWEEEEEATMKIGEIIRKLLNDGANTVEECLDLMYDEKYRAEIAGEDFFYDALYFLEDIQNRSACITRTDEDGDVENYCFYIDEDGNLVSDHDMRCLNDDGERFMCDEWDNEPCTLEEIVDIWSLGNGDEWHKGWNNVDCNL